MNRTLKLAAPLIAALTVAACSGGSSTVLGSAGAGQSGAPARSVPMWQARHLAHPACAALRGGVQCLALIESRRGNETSGYGWTPADFQARYNLPSSTKGSGQIVAIVDAYDNPDVSGDLDEYRSHFNLGTANFYKYNQEGQQKNYPQGSPSWGVEIDLDVEMVSAVCSKCTIYLVEANSQNGSDMDAAEVEAVKLGGHVISNSWICYSYSCTVDPKDFDTRGVMYLAGSGDAGYGYIGPPMAYTTVLAVGGTVLSDGGSGYSETVWDGAGSGCTPEVAKPKWQRDPDCSNRTDADVSAVAWDVAEYDSFSAGGWFTVGGTSVATPLTAGVYGLAGNAKAQHAGKELWSLSSKKRKKSLHYISSGSNGSCGSSYLCTAGTKQFKTYSGPAGWGTPNGVGAY